MDLLSTVINAGVIAIVGALVGLVARGQTRNLERQLQDLKDDNRSHFDRIATEIAALRSDLLRVALAVGAQPEAS